MANDTGPSSAADDTDERRRRKSRSRSKVSSNSHADDKHRPQSKGRDLIKKHSSSKRRIKEVGESSRDKHKRTSTERRKDETKSSREKRDVNLASSTELTIDDDEKKRRSRSRKLKASSTPRSATSIEKKGSSPVEKKEMKAEGSLPTKKRGSADIKKKRRPSVDDLGMLEFQKQERRDSMPESLRSKSAERSGSRRLSDHDNNKDKKVNHRLKGGRRKKKAVVEDSMVVVSDKGVRGKHASSLFTDSSPIPTDLFSFNLEEFEDDAIEEEQPKRSSIGRSDSGKKKMARQIERSKSRERRRKYSEDEKSNSELYQRRSSSNREKEHSNHGNVVKSHSTNSRPRRCTLTEWDKDPDMVTAVENAAEKKEGSKKSRFQPFRRSSSDGMGSSRRLNSKDATNTGQKRLSLDSSLKLIGKSFANLDPERKKTRSRSVESHKSDGSESIGDPDKPSKSSRRKNLKSAKGSDRFAKSVRLTRAERPSLRRHSNSLNDLDASIGSSDESSSTDDDDPNPTSQKPRRKKQDLVADMLVISEGKKNSTNNPSSIPTSIRKSSLEIFEENAEEVQRLRSGSVESADKAKRRHTEKIKKKESSQKPFRRSNSINAILSSDKRKAFMEKRRNSIDASFIARRKSGESVSKRRISKGSAHGSAKSSLFEKEEEHKTRAGESTSELEALMQKDSSMTCKTSKSSTKSSVSSGDKRLSRKKRKTRRKWFTFICCAFLLLVILATVIVIIIGRAYDKAETAKAGASNTTTVMGGVGASVFEQPSQAPTIMDGPSESFDVAVVIIVQLDDKPDETGFSLISADNSTTWVYYPFGSLAGRQSDIVTEVVNIPVNTEVLFTFTDKSGGICCDDGNGYYKVLSGSGEQKRSLISGDRNSEYRFVVGQDTATQTGGMDPNESCKPCPDGKECGRCAWCNAARGFLPDTIFSYQCHTPLLSVNEKCFIGAKRVVLHNQYVAAMAKCTNGFEPWPQLQSTIESALCVSEVKCVKKYSFVDPDCEAELSGSVLVRESCQDVIGGSAFGYDFALNAPRENECRPGFHSEANFFEALSSRCCVDGVSFCSTFDESSSVSDEYQTSSAAFAGPEPTLSPTVSNRPSVSDPYQMTIVIMLDEFPRETGWTLTSKNSEITYMKRVPGYYRESSKLAVETVPVPEGTNAIFTITDEEGDGLCCENGEGYFQIYTADGSLVVDESGSFESSTSVSVFAGKPLTLPPTVSLSPTTSAVPTQGLFPITIAVQFDQWATETGFSLLSLDGKVLYEWSPGSFVEPNQRFDETVKLPYASEVIFKATDTGGDGFCCLYGDGSVTILAGEDSADESAIIERKSGEFQSELSFSFRVGPPPTSQPTITPVPSILKSNSLSGHPTSSSQPSVRSLEVTVVVQFDKYPSETGWFIDSVDGETNYVARPLGYYQDMPNGKVEETVILPEGLNYKFKIIDLFGDGSCCWAGNGWYALYEGTDTNDIRSQIFFGNGEYGLEREHFFTVGTKQTNAPSVSDMPSVSPSHTPTTKPSISSHPTETMYLVDLTVKLDSLASETGFYIASISDGTIYFDRPPGYFNGMDKETIEESISLPAGEYHFALLDTGGNGFCCQQGFGFYSLYDNESGEVLVFRDGNFGDAKNETFTVGGTTSVGLRGSLLPHRQRNHED